MTDHVNEKTGATITRQRRTIERIHTRESAERGEFLLADLRELVQRCADLPAAAVVGVTLGHSDVLFDGIAVKHVEYDNCAPPETNDAVAQLPADDSPADSDAGMWGDVLMSVCTDEQRPTWWETPDFGAYHSQLSAHHAPAYGPFVELLTDFARDLDWLGERDAFDRLHAVGISERAPRGVAA